MPQVRSYRFASFEVDASAGEVWKNGKKVQLQEQPLRFLLALLEVPGQVVSREELRSRLWPDHTFVDFDHSINVAVSKVREALGDSAEEPRFIETMPRRGYRFVSAVEVLADSPPVDDDLGRSRRPRGQRAGVVLLAVGAMVLAITLFQVWRHFQKQPAVGAVRSIAILPFDNVSGDPSQQYLADGITQALITELGKIHDLRVISWQSVVRFHDSETPLPEIAYLLDVEAAVTGSVVSAGGRVGVSAQLVAVEPERHLWSESYEETLGDLLDVRNRIAAAVAQAVSVEISPEMASHLETAKPVVEEAYDAYLQGLYQLNRFSKEGFETAVQHFETAVGLDPEFAIAYSGLADEWLMLGYYAYSAPAAAFPRAEVAARRALALDEGLAAAHNSMGAVLYCYLWDFEHAEIELRRALELNPGSSLSRSWYSWILADAGRHEAALEEIRGAQLLDPLSAVVSSVVGLRLYDARRYDQAIPQLRMTLEMHPDFLPAQLFLGMSLQRTGSSEMAVEVLLRAVELSKGAPIHQAALASALVASDRRSEAEQILARLIDRSKEEYVSAFHIATVLETLGETEKSLQWLERAFDERSPWMTRLGIDPRFDSIRADKRFVDLLRRVGIRKEAPISNHGAPTS